MFIGYNLSGRYMFRLHSLASRDYLLSPAFAMSAAEMDWYQDLSVASWVFREHNPKGPYLRISSRYFEIFLRSTSTVSSLLKTQILTPRKA